MGTEQERGECASFRYSLGSLLAVIALIALVLGISAPLVKRDRSAQAGCAFASAGATSCIQCHAQAETLTIPAQSPKLAQAQVPRALNACPDVGHAGLSAGQGGMKAVDCRSCHVSMPVR